MRITCNGQLALAVLLTSALVFGCAEHEDNMQGLHSQEITFAPQMVNDWNGVTTRSVMQQNATAKVQKLQDGLYLHTVVSPGFESDRQQEKVTRGALVTGISGFGGHFGVSGHAYDGTASATATADFLYKADVQLVNNNWVTNETFVWPQKEHISFYAYSPYNDNKVSVADKATEGPMKITFTVSSDTASQVDLMTAVSDPWTHKTDEPNVVPLTFQHQLTAVQFAIDANTIPGVLQKIEFQHISMTGTLTASQVYSETDSWALGTTTDYTLDFTNNDPDGGINLVSGNSINTNVVITKNPLLMIPQNFTSGLCRILVTIKDGANTYDLSASLNGTKWLPGTTVTYKISTSSENVLRISEVTYPTTWSAASTAFSSIKSSYVATNDVLGVYAINTNGEVVKENEPLTKTANGWEHNILFVPGLTYFAYYPYNSKGLAHSGTKNDQVVTTAEDFFASGISAWTPAANQNTADELNAQDLQVGTGTVESASTVSFAMAHSMGLASLTLAEGTIPEVRYFIVNASGSINENGVAGTDYIDIGEKSVDASSNFTTTGIENINTNMLINGRKYYYVVNPHQTAITLNGPTTGEGSWTTPNVELDVTAGNYKAYSVNHQGAYYYKGWLYQYRGKNQLFEVPTDGAYRVECWGASSYKMAFYSEEGNPGLGGYTRGDINLEHEQKLYIYVGGEGSGTSSSGGGGWNGGGNGVCVTSYLVGGGGGATDIRLRLASTTDPTVWNNFTSLTTRIMVAGGGGAISQDGYSGAAGGLIGYRAGTNSASGYGGTQTAGGSPGTDYYVNGRASSGSFGYGSNGYSHGPGGGGGWYGGAGGTRSTVQDGGGGGGSSYISGHPGCNSVGSTATADNRQHTGSPNYRDEAFIFTNTRMIDGKGFEWTETAQPGNTVVPFPKPTENATETGHQGSGYIRIASLTPIQ